MFFKRLELFGFKSFSQKTKLDFEAGVTAVVGPNGCGKSNIADGIKWVLGEQSVRRGYPASRLCRSILNYLQPKQDLTLGL